MNRVLTQSEIDALLSVVTDASGQRRGANASDSVTRYNFRRPDRVSKEEIQSVLFLHERYARNIAMSLSAYLRTVMSFSVESVEQFAYSEFLSALTDPTAFYALAIPPFDELGAVEINPSVAFAMVDRMLGGAGRPVTVSRALTEIEQNVIDAVVKLLLDGLAEVWKPVTNLTFTVRGRETRPSMLQVAAPNEVVVMVVFDVKLGEAKGTINLCLPTSVVEMAGAHFAKTFSRQRRELTPVERGWMEENLGRAGLPVVPLVRAEIGAPAILDLRVGEIIELPLPLSQPIDVHIGGVKKLSGRMASEDNHLLVVVENRCEAMPAALGGV
jgi:flagellar motor switch protein FliM